MNRVSCWLRARLRRRLFVWFGISIVMTGVATAIAVLLYPGRPDYQENWRRAERFVAGRLAEVWKDPIRRDELARAAATDLGIGVRLEDATGRTLSQFGPTCDRHAFETTVVRDGVTLGVARACMPRSRRGPGPFLLALVVFGGTLWAASGVVARRLSRPIEDVVRVAKAIGEGDLSVRTAARHDRSGEVGALSDAIDEMASRIQRQMTDQRELLAAVSHEIRSPLARIRVLSELARERGASEGLVAELERELSEIDSLVGDLLAGSRLDFDAVDARPLDASEAAARALARAGLDGSLLQGEDGLQVNADATLLARALANLLENASRHGGGATALTIAHRAGQVAFIVEDGGPGFPEELLPRVFDSFVR